MFHKRRSFFPLVLGLLTIILIVVIIMNVEPGTTPVNEERQPETIITEDDYRDRVIKIVQAFDEGYASAQDSAVKELVAEKALSDMLSLQVPNLYRDVHLELAVALNTLANSDDADARAAAKTAIESVRSQYPWLP